MVKKKCVLTIAGSDSGAGAGIQSDLKTFKNHGLYGVTVITAITAQNTLGVQKVYDLRTEIVEEQLKSVLSDFKISHIKTGMLSNGNVIETAAKHIKKQGRIKLVIDPVILSKNGKALLSEQGINVLIKKLIPLSYLITPNIPEAEMLTGVSIDSMDDIEIAAVILYEMGAKNVLIKGGHMKKSTGLAVGTDILFDGSRFYMFNAQIIKSRNTHGIGCTLSAAITSNLVLGYSLIDSVQSAKNYIVKSLKRSAIIGKGKGPVEQ
jgi:hydroxymethylpyrimidine/phosphomethylpyrimidine kinase